MPGKRPPPKAATMILTSAGGVVVGIVLFLIVLALAGPKSAEQSRKATFKVGNAKSLVGSVDRNGPLLFQDPLNRGRDIYVQHIDGREWRAFDARPPGALRRCTLMWQPASRDFRDPCSGQTFPADGTGLSQYPATVDAKGALIVDLSATGVAPTATSAPTSPSTPATSTSP